MTSDALSARSEALLDVAESIASHQSLPALLLALSSSLARLVPFAGIGIVLYDADRRVSKLYHLKSSLRHGIPSEYEFTAEQSTTATVLETGQSLYIPDLEAETRYPVLMRMLRESGIRSYCVAPLFTERRQLGSLASGSLDRNAYRSDQIEFMKQVARQVALAVENTLNYEAARRFQEELIRERDRLRLLLEVNNAIVAHLETESLFKAISGSLRETLKVDLASLTLWDPESNQLRRQALDLEGSHHTAEQDQLVPM